VLDGEGASEIGESGDEEREVEVRHGLVKVTRWLGVVNALAKKVGTYCSFSAQAGARVGPSW
ncbi:MAG: hypothetical protein V3V65_03870, partial [Hyphomicrobium sp.]